MDRGRHLSLPVGTLAAAAETAAGPVAGQILRPVYSGEIPPRTAVELFCGRRRASPAADPPAR